MGPAAQALEEADLHGLVEGKNLRRASCLHALSRPEIGHLRTIAPWTPVCFVPNGVDLRHSTTCPPGRCSKPSIPSWPASSCCSSSAGARQEGPRPAGRGPWPVAPASRSFTSSWPARTTVPGPVLRPDGGARLGRANDLGRPCSGERARQVWAAADAFILPSYSEGFSMAVLEALACRLARA